jgi:hypothetical protein
MPSDEDIGKRCNTTSPTGRVQVPVLPTVAVKLSGTRWRFRVAVNPHSEILTGTVAVLGVSEVGAQITTAFGTCQLVAQLRWVAGLLPQDVAKSMVCLLRGRAPRGVR